MYSFNIGTIKEAFRDIKKHPRSIKILISSIHGVLNEPLWLVGLLGTTEITKPTKMK